MAPRGSAVVAAASLGWDPVVSQFAELLSRGGSEAPADVFSAFRGRPPSAQALLRHSGLVAA